MRRYLLASTPAQGHTAPLLALARTLVDNGDEVVFYTTPNYRDKVLSTGAGFEGFAPEFDAHDLMVANPDRERGLRRGLGGVRDDLRRIFIDPIPMQAAGVDKILNEFQPDVVIADSMFLGVLALAGRERNVRPRVVIISVMPLPLSSRDTAPFGSALRPSTSPLGRIRNHTMNWLVRHVVMGDIQRYAQEKLFEAGGPRLTHFLVDAPAQLADSFLQATAESIEYPRSDLPTSVRFVGSIDPLPTEDFKPPPWWGHLDARRPVVHVTQGTLDNADLSRLVAPTLNALAGEDVFVVATTGGPDPSSFRTALPANAVIERLIPHNELLGKVDVMVTNGGYGGVQQALSNGVPLIVAGDSEDKPEVATRVEWSGAGINLRSGRPRASQIRNAVLTVLTNPSYTINTRRIQRDLLSHDPLDEIVAVLNDVAN
ncbi:MAG: glycosyltransferase [Actinobacteria bacterium]|nr:glycosyltransferase [Actinomycetota bacterium]MCL5445259.1 glycosyltransferase [Actinomycetota bacterium]